VGSFILSSHYRQRRSQLKRKKTPHFLANWKDSPQEGNQEERKTFPFFPPLLAEKEYGASFSGRRREGGKYALPPQEAGWLRRRDDVVPSPRNVRKSTLSSPLFSPLAKEQTPYRIRNQRARPPLFLPFPPLDETSWPSSLSSLTPSRAARQTEPLFLMESRRHCSAAHLPFLPPPPLSILSRAIQFFHDFIAACLSKLRYPSPSTRSKSSNCRVKESAPPFSLFAPFRGRESFLLWRERIFAFRKEGKGPLYSIRRVRGMGIGSPSSFFPSFPPLFPFMPERRCRDFLLLSS